MKGNNLGKELHTLYIQAIENLHFASEVLIKDEEITDKSVELLIAESAYSIACFSRAIRATKAAKTLNPKISDLRLYFDQSVALMEGDEKKRLKSFLLHYFDESRLRDQFKYLMDQIKLSIEADNFHELKEDDIFAQKVFDYFLFFDRLLCLTHPVDSPLKGLIERAKVVQLKKSMLKSFRELKSIFDVYAETFKTYRSNVFIPNELAYEIWFSLKEVSVEEFITAYENALATAFENKKIAYFSLLNIFPQELRNRIGKLKLEKKIPDLIDKFSDQVQEIFDQIAVSVQAPALNQEPTWGDTEKDIKINNFEMNLLISSPQSAYGDTDAKIENILSLNREDLQKETARLEKDKSLSGEVKKDVLILAYILTGDEDKLKKLLRKD